MYYAKKYLAFTFKIIRRNEAQGLKNNTYSAISVYLLKVPTHTQLDYLEILNNLSAA
jgi:hypothetical protein